MPGRRAPHGSWGAYRRHLKDGTPVCAACRDFVRAKRAKDGAEAPGSRQEPPPPPPAIIPILMPTASARVEELRALLEVSRSVLVNLQVMDPARAYLQMREQRDILREIDAIENAGAEVKEPTLADQLADARARRAAGA